MNKKQFFHPYSDTVQGLCLRLHNCPGLLWLNDGGNGVVGLFPQWQLIALQPDETLKQLRQGLDYQESIQKQDFFSSLQTAWSAHGTAVRTAQTAASIAHALASSLNNTAPSQSVEFQGGLLGFIGYDLAASQFASLKQGSSPLAMMGYYDIFLSRKRWAGNCMGRICLRYSPYMMKSHYVWRL